MKNTKLKDLKSLREVLVKLEGITKRNLAREPIKDPSNVNFKS
jgi:hypothetical protein